jgi:hypothetical protein
LPQTALRDSLPRPVATGVADRPRARTAKHRCRPTTGRAPTLFAHPGLCRDCVETSLVGLPLPMDPSDLEGYLQEICQHCWLALLASMQLRACSTL